MFRILDNSGKYLAACALAMLVPFGVAQASTPVTVLHAFASTFFHTVDGAQPIGTPILDKSGNLYGVTSQGGDAKCLCGVVYKITQPKKEKLLHIFSGGDGSFPTGGLVADSAGNLYGVTQTGGAHSRGVVFRVKPSGKETVLYSFCKKTKCNDGSTPFGTLIVDNSGNLYGTTSAGGALGQGTIFKLAADGSETVLHSFKGNSDGATPMAGMIMDKAGNFFGTTSAGGSISCEGPGCGTVFELTKAGKEKAVYAFCAVGSCTEGQEPRASLIEDSKGNFYGTTRVGGAHGLGTIFKLSSLFKETVLYSFCSVGTSSQCTDGSEPLGELHADGEGNFYGTTIFAGAYGNGVIFELLKNGKEKVVHAFSGGTDGDQPNSGLAADANGNLYSVGQSGGSKGEGTIFKLTP